MGGKFAVYLLETFTIVNINYRRSIPKRLFHHNSRHDNKHKTENTRQEWLSGTCNFCVIYCLCSRKLFLAILNFSNAPKSFFQHSIVQKKPSVPECESKCQTANRQICAIRVSERMSCEESAILFTYLAYISHIRQKYSIFPVSIKANLKKVISTDVSGQCFYTPSRFMGNICKCKTIILDYS